MPELRLSGLRGRGGMGTPSEGLLGGLEPSEDIGLRSSGGLGTPSGPVGGNLPWG